MFRRTPCERFIDWKSGGQVNLTSSPSNGGQGGKKQWTGSLIGRSSTGTAAGHPLPGLKKAILPGRVPVYANANILSTPE